MENSKFRVALKVLQECLTELESRGLDHLTTEEAWAAYRLSKLTEEFASEYGATLDSMADELGLTPLETECCRAN